ncbi:MAG: Gp37 family protein [Burkholderiaceae bacterium]|nr:Gp37 family protein [Burkholderiaceae bacterium]
MATLIEQIETALVERLKAAFTTPGKPHPLVDVLAWPGDPRTYKMSHPIGACLVICRGTTDDGRSSTAGQRVEQMASYEIGVLARTLREHQPPQGAELGTGAYDLIDTCRRALMGWRVPEASGVTKVLRDDFDDYVEGVWGYSIKLAVPTLRVIDIPEVAAPWMAGESTVNTMGYVGAGNWMGETLPPVPDAESAFTPYTPPPPVPPDYP